MSECLKLDLKNKLKFYKNILKWTASKEKVAIRADVNRCKPNPNQPLILDKS